MPPSGFSKKIVAGLLIFIKGCYEDLLKEVKSGKHKTYEEAIEYEIKQINSALSKLHIDHTGNLVEK